jgi:hypothetical protein
MAAAHLHHENLASLQLVVNSLVVLTVVLPPVMVLARRCSQFARG